MKKLSNRSTPIWPIFGRVSLALCVLCGAAGIARADHAEPILKAALDAHIHREYSEAVNLYTHAIATDELSGIPLADAYSARAIDYLRLFDYGRALNDLNQSLLLHPTNATAHYNLGLCLNGLGKYHQAIRSFGNALRYGSDVRNFFSRIHFHRGNAYYELQEFRRAIEDYDRALELRPRYIRAYDARGKSFYELGEHRRAIADFDEALRRNPNFVSAYLNRGNAFLALGHRMSADSDFAKAESLGLDVPNFP